MKRIPGQVKPISHSESGAVKRYFLPAVEEKFNVSATLCAENKIKFLNYIVSSVDICFKEMSLEIERKQLLNVASET